MSPPKARSRVRIWFWWIFILRRGKLVDGPQALTLDELPLYLEDIAIAREEYEKPRRLATLS
jgi:hypothetical protein